ncbi:hypothetical protein O9992_27910 [Vibrio lentus]|nr:hypothetical protein [Vibrio lentus]
MATALTLMTQAIYIEPGGIVELKSLQRRLSTKTLSESHSP